MEAIVKKEWFYSSLGQRRGPVTHKDICDFISRREISIEAVKVWKEGMSQWANLSEVKSFGPDIKRVKEASARMEAHLARTIRAPGFDTELESRGSSRTLFNLFFYVGWILPMLLGIAIISELQVQQIINTKLVGKLPWLSLTPLVIWVVALWGMTSSRMNNIGYSASSGWMIFVPVLNLWTLFVCLFARSNFAHKKGFGLKAGTFFLVFCGVLTALMLDVVPGIKAKQLLPLAMNKKLTQIYAEKTNFKKRHYEEAKKAAAATARREQQNRQGQ